MGLLTPQTPLKGDFCSLSAALTLRKINCDGVFIPGTNNFFLQVGLIDYCSTSNLAEVEQKVL